MLAFLVIRVIPEVSTVCGYRIMAITSAFQADDVGSIPASCSPVKLMVIALLSALANFREEQTWQVDLLFFIL